MSISSFRESTNRPFLRLAMLTLATLVLELLWLPNFAVSLVAQELDPKAESRIQSQIATLRELFPWIDDLKVFPELTGKLIWLQDESGARPNRDWPQFAVVLKDTDAQLDFMRLDLWQTKRDKQEKYFTGFKGLWYRHVDIDTASYLWSRYLENGLPEKLRREEKSRYELALSGLLLAKIAAQNGKSQNADEVLRRIVKTDLSAFLTRQKLEPNFQLIALKQVHSDLCGIDIDRANLRDRLKQFAVTFPSSKHISRAKGLLTLMSSMAAEDAAHDDTIALNQSENNQQARIDELVFQLRNLASRPYFNKIYADAMRDPRRAKNPASQLARIGLPAVPSLIRAIDDERLSCCATNRSAEEFMRPLTVGECAIFVLSEISSRKFSHHLTPSRMFEKAPGIEKARQEIAEWWQTVQQKGELEYLRERIGFADGEAFGIAEILLKKYRDEAVPILAKHQQRLEPNEWHQIVSLVAEDPRPVDAGFFESQRDSRNLSARVHAARALQKLGHSQGVEEQLAFWRRVVDSPKLLAQITKSDSDVNGRIQLVKFLANCGRPDTIDALSRGMSQIDPDYCHTIMDCVYLNFGRNKTDWSEEVAPQPKPVRDASIRLYLSALADVRVQPKRNSGTFVELDNDEKEKPKPMEERVCDWAAGYLTNLRAGEPRYDYQLPLKERDERIESIRKLHNVPEP